MTDPGTQAPDSQGRLDDWLELMHPRLARLQDFELPDDFPFDYSRESLGAIEAIILQRSDDGAWSTPDDHEFVEGAMGYLGEALLRVAGGSWGWDDDDESPSYDLPIVRPDADLELPPVSPLDLIVSAASRRSGTELARVYETLRAAVKDRQTSEPSWTPTKELSPGVDDDLDPPPSEFLERWLTERAAAFPDWVAFYADDQATWDFSPESLDRLETLVRSTIPSFEDFTKAEYADFAQGAAWYLGQVMHLTTGGQWFYNPGDPDPFNPWRGRPYIQQMVQDGSAQVPILAIKNSLRVRDAGFLRARLQRFR